MSKAEELGKSKRANAAKSKSKKTVRGTPFVCQVAAMRAAHGLNLEEVAAAAGMSKTGLWQIEQGGDPMLSTAFKLAKFFDRSISELWSKVN
jgi:DNA-binding XRE family transcriptional regulator